MIVTPKLIKTIMDKLHQPAEYKIFINFILPHGNGVVVGFTVETHTTTEVRVEHRCAGFIPSPNSEGGIHCKYDMIV